jgi:hypothetical protein
VVEALLRREDVRVSENALLARARGHLLRRGAVLAAFMLLVALLCASPTWAKTFTVTNLNDSGTGSLRAAINDAEARAGKDEIVFADGLSGTITLGSELPTITDRAGLVIDGGGDVTVSGNNAVQVLEVAPKAKLDLRSLTVSDGSNIVGGAIFNAGTLKVTNSTFSGNRATTGGAIENAGTLEVTNSTFFGNTATGGGAIENAGGGTLKVTNSTFSGNRATTGGAIENAGTLEVTNSTFFGNTATGGGAIRNGGVGTVEVINSTFSGNTATSGGALLNGESSSMTLGNTIVANSTFGGNCSFEFGNPITDGGYNIDDDGTCGFTQATGSLPDTNPLLDPAGLADNGGPTLTIALQPESPAVDLVGQEACPPPKTDQRGVERPQGEACDSGSFELVQEEAQGPQSKVEAKTADTRSSASRTRGSA